MAIGSRRPVHSADRRPAVGPARGQLVSRHLHAEDRAPARQDRARRAHAGPPDRDLRLRMGLVAASRIRGGGKAQSVSPRFRFHPGGAEPQFRPARHRAGKARRADPEPFAPRPLRRSGRLCRPLSAAAARGLEAIHRGRQPDLPREMEPRPRGRGAGVDGRARRRCPCRRACRDGVVRTRARPRPARSRRARSLGNHSKR